MPPCSELLTASNEQTSRPVLVLAGTNRPVRRMRCTTWTPSTEMLTAQLAPLATSRACQWSQACRQLARSSPVRLPPGASTPRPLSIPRSLECGAFRLKHPIGAPDHSAGFLPQVQRRVPIPALAALSCTTIGRAPQFTAGIGQLGAARRRWESRWKWCSWPDAAAAPGAGGCRHQHLCRIASPVAPALR